MKTALITGITGQDGSYLAELLLSKGYRVHGLIRPSSGKDGHDSRNIAHIAGEISLHAGDITDEKYVRGCVASLNPHEIYHLASNHEVGMSVLDYLVSRGIHVDCTMYFLSAISDLRPECRFFFASSSNVFGLTASEPQNESTGFCPNSIYGVTKVAGMHLVRLYRGQKGLYGCSGILFNHESPRRHPYFLPRKITSTAAKIKLGLESRLELGELDARKDWGFAGDYVEAMWLSLQAEKPDDYVIGTGETHTVRDILDIVFGLLDLDWKQYVKVNPALVRPKNPTMMVADITKISATLDWKPKTKFSELMRMMIEEDMRLARAS